MDYDIEIDAKITKTGKKVFLELESDNFLSNFRKDKHIEISVKIDNDEFIIDSLFVETKHTSVNSEGVSFSSICPFNILRSKNFNFKDKSIFKCFILTDEKKLDSFIFQLETVAYISKGTLHAYDCLRIDLDSIQFDIIQLKNENKGFYVIESIQEVEFEFFRDHCFAIKQALGFVTSYMPGGEEYYFSEGMNFFYTNLLRPQISSIYYPVITNPYSRLYFNQSLAEKYMGKLNLISLEVFSRLVSEIVSKDEFSATLILLLEASSVRSFLLIPSVFAVVVEALSKYISIQETGQVLPITDPRICQELLKQLNSVLDSFTNEIEEEGLLKIKRRINEINRPIVKEHLTNNEKLTLPFEQLKIKLSIHDIAIIEHRNDLFHGNFLLKSETQKTLDDTNNYIGYVSGKLYTLISALILKYIGYKGYIINHSKFYEDVNSFITEEEYFIEI